VPQELGQGLQHPGVKGLLGLLVCSRDDVPHGAQSRALENEARSLSPAGLSQKVTATSTSATSHTALLPVGTASGHSQPTVTVTIFFCFVVLGFELRACTLSHSTSLFL
jgi:hypothetical protein